MQSVLVDSGFYINRLRAGADPFQELNRFVGEYNFFTCGIVQVEVLRGIRNRTAFERTSEVMKSMFFLPTTDQILHQTLALAWQLDRTGKVMQVTDLIIAACALEAGACVLTLDRDFHHVPNLHVIHQLELR
ncbi:MAG: PIN domain-containing protein [Chthoniobacteraceae bacterium]